MNFASIFRRLDNILYPSNNEIWMENLGVLESFFAEFGRPPKQKETFNGFRIGPWLFHQKQMYKQGILSEERIYLLSKVGADPSLDVLETQWQEHYDGLKDFIAEFGRLPRRDESFNDLLIGSWLFRQKRGYKQGLLSDERVRLLTEAGFDLSLDVLEAQWQKHYDGLKDFIAKFGRPPKQKESFNDLRIGPWLGSQKHIYKQGKLSDKRIRLLTEAGINLSLDIFEAQWFEYYTALKGFISEFDRTPKYNESFDGLHVGQWLNTQKQNYKKGGLSEERAKHLTEVGVVLTIEGCESSWHKNFNVLRNFIAEFGRLPQHNESFNGLRVGLWLAKQKQMYKQGKLSEKRVRLLTEAGIDLSLDVYESQWLGNYSALNGFVAEFGRMPKNDESFNGLRVGKWLGAQRQRYRKGKLSEERRMLLEETGVSF